MTKAKCIDCEVVFEGRAYEIPQRCTDCGGLIRSLESYREPENTRTDKI